MFRHVVILFVISYLIPVQGTVKLLWPLDSKTCTSEVLSGEFQENQPCFKSFGPQPEGFLFNSMVFDGASYLDFHVDFPAFNVEHYSFHGFFYLTQPSAALFNYRAQDTIREDELWVVNGILRLYRIIGGKHKIQNGVATIYMNTWYFISLVVDHFGYVHVYVNGKKDIYAPVGGRKSIDEPGNLRIGGSFNVVDTFLTGRIICFGMSWKTYNPDENEIRTLCQTTPWMHDCFVSVNNIPIYSGTRSVTVAGQTCQRWDTTFPHKPLFPMSSDHSNYCRSPDEDFTLWCYTMDPDVVWNKCDVPQCVPEQRPANNLYFAPISDIFIVPELLSSEIQCSILRCSLSCLRDIRCYYIHYNEADDGCSPCYMYSKYEMFSQSYNTLELYKVNHG